MIVLDTNVISELMRVVPDQNVIDLVDRYPAEQVFTTAVTAAELLYGVSRLPEGRRKTTLALKVDELLTEDFEGRILPFASHIAPHYADIVTSREQNGKAISMADAQIAAICRFNRADLVTRNVKDFDDTNIRIVNPWVG